MSCMKSRGLFRSAHTQSTLCIVNLLVVFVHKFGQPKPAELVLLIFFPENTYPNYIYKAFITLISLDVVFTGTNKSLE